MVGGQSLAMLGGGLIGMLMGMALGVRFGIVAGMACSVIGIPVGTMAGLIGFEISQLPLERCGKAWQAGMRIRAGFWLIGYASWILTLAFAFLAVARLIRSSD